MLRKSLAIIGLVAITAHPALAGPPQPEAIISALESAYNHPRMFFTANTVENTTSLDELSASIPQNYVQRYCRDGKKLDVSAEAESPAPPVAADAASRYERLVLTPSTRVALRNGEEVGAVPVAARPAADSDARSFALNLLHGGEALDGYLAGDLEPLPQVLREAKSVKVRPEMEVVGDTPCVVVEATSKHGLYTLWLDESNDATLRKAEVVKNNGDQYKDLPRLGAMTVDGAPVQRTRFTMDNVAVEKINGKAVPVSARMETTFTLTDGRTQTIRREHTRSGMDLDPDFTAIGAFNVDPNAGR